MPDGSVRCEHTIKRGIGLVRQETNRTITAAEFESLWPRTAGRRLTKTRRRIRHGELLWEIDHIRELEVHLAEVELPSATTPIEIPPWLKPHISREVTHEPAFTNYELARQAIARVAVDERRPQGGLRPP